ncbi:poly-beta-1,6-N-acetyl-D-glucosamine biosynthesis protein PgaD [Luteibacter sp. PPL201]|uniref:Poly-beta-1,6-N-acetyl-D-glucosamine biosynthesis protein PgaD n=1 Tax=Luteibacter sahnii TaxID=3021977 RepID=A0ABT6B8S9_9GAMM
MKAESIVIQRPERQSAAQKLMFAIVTVAAWVFWVFLWLPLVTLGAWAFGLHDAWLQLHVLDREEDSGNLRIVLGCAMASAAVFAAWSMYNYKRFAGRQKRRGNAPVDVVETARSIGATTDDALRMQSHRRVVVRVADDGFMSLDDAR